MDTKLRELERAALGGDAEAKKRFLTEKLRAGNYYPVMFTFDDLGGGSVYASRWLKGGGNVKYFDDRACLISRRYSTRDEYLG